MLAAYCEILVGLMVAFTGPAGSDEVIKSEECLEISLVKIYSLLKTQDANYYKFHSIPVKLQAYIDI